MRILTLLAILILPVFLPGCAGLAGRIAGGDLTDRLVARLATFNDQILEDLVEAEAVLKEKAARLARAKCRFPFTALVRYARTSEAHRTAVEDDCGLVVNPIAATVTRALQDVIAGSPATALGGPPGGPPR